MLVKNTQVSLENFSSLRSISISGLPTDEQLLSQCRDKLQIEDIRQSFFFLFFINNTIIIQEHANIQGYNQ